MGGATWAGITRNYRTTPMIPGEFPIPPQEVVVTYANPETSESVKVTLRTGAVAFSGVVPEGAAELDPFIAADELELTQKVDGDPTVMKPGDSVTWTVTAHIRGISPMFLPDLLPRISIDGIAVYPCEPAVDETEYRGVLSGTRTESVTFIAEAGGAGLCRRPRWTGMIWRAGGQKLL